MQWTKTHYLLFSTVKKSSQLYDEKLQEYYNLAALNINMTKCEYMSLGDNNVEDLPVIPRKYTREHKCKFLGVVVDKIENSRDEIKKNVNKKRKAIKLVNSPLRNKI